MLLTMKNWMKEMLIFTLTLDQMLQISFGVREILEIHNHFLVHLGIAIGNWEEVRISRGMLLKF